MPIFFRTLGQIDLRDDAGVELRGLLTQPKRLAILVYLAATSTARLCRRDTLLGMFWPESDDERARAALRQALHFIRQELGPDAVISRGADELGVSPDALHLDARDFETLAASGKHEDALALFSGDFLNGFFVRGAPLFEKWVDAERNRLRRIAAESAWLVVESRLAVGDLGTARSVAEKAVKLSADSEVAVRRLIAMLAETGDHAAAASTYDEFARELANEFGVEPSAETRSLVESLATSLPSSAKSPRAPRPSNEPGGVASSDTAVGETPPTAHATSTTAHDSVNSASVAVNPRRPLARVARWATAAFAIAAIAFAIIKSDLLGERVDTDSRRVVVLPFVVRGSNDLRYLRDGLPLLFSTRLDGVANLHAVDMRAVLLDQSRHPADSLDPKAPREAAARFGAGLYLVGSVVGNANGLHVDVSLYDRRNERAPIARTQLDGSESELVTLVDDAVSKLLADRFRGDGVLVAEMAARTTPSFVALKAWLDGESSMAAGRYEPAMQSFRAAIAADSNFAMAWYRLAVASSWAGDLTQVVPAAQRAVKLSNRLPPSARTIVAAFLDSRQGRYLQAERAERELLAERPAAIDVWFDLGEALYHGNPARGRSIAEAQDAFEHVLRMDPRNFAAQVHLARLAASRGDATVLDSLTTLALTGSPDGPHRAELLLLRGLGLHDEGARREIIASRPEIPQLDALWRAAEYTGELREAEVIAHALLDRASSRELRSALFLFLAHDAIGREQFPLAQQYIDSLSQYAPHYAAITTAIAARHPAAVALRQQFLARADSALRAADTAHSMGRTYDGILRDDDITTVAPFVHAMVRLDLHANARDSALARALLERPNISRGDERGARINLTIALATKDDERADAMTAVATLDSLYGNSYATQTPLAPRAAMQLAVLPLMRNAGRNQDALDRLATVPEDFGFNIAYVAEVHRRRAELLDALGQRERANTERARAAQIVR